MKVSVRSGRALGALAAGLLLTSALVPSGSAQAQEAKKPNILFIMGDDIGWMQPGAYHRGLMVGETPNIDRIGQRGRRSSWTTCAMQSCTSGRNAFFTGMYPLRTGMIPPQLPGSPTYLKPGTPAVAKFLLDLGYTTGEFGKNHLGDHTDALPTAHGFQEYWGYLYHLDAMQGVSFPDINKNPTDADRVTALQEHADPGRPRGAGRGGPEDHDLPDAAAPGALVQLLRRHGGEPELQGRGAAHARPVEDRGRGDLGQGRRLPRPQRPQEDRQAVLRLVQPGAHARHHRAAAEVRGDGRRAGRQGLGPQRGRHEAARRQYRLRPQEARGHGPARQHDRRLHHRQRRRDDHLPRRRRDAVQGAEGRVLRGRLPRPGDDPLAGHIKPGTVYNQLFAALDWLPTLTEIAGGPKGDGLKKQIEQGAYPGIVKTTLDGVNQTEYLTGKSQKSARDVFYYFSGATPSAVRYKNWKMYYTMSQPGAEGWILPLVPFHFTLVDNIKRDPFEKAVGLSQDSALSLGGALGSPSTAFLYDWNLLPIGQQLWLEWFETLKAFPPMQAPASYNLTQVMDQIQGWRPGTRRTSVTRPATAADRAPRQGRPGSTKPAIVAPVVRSG